MNSEETLLPIYQLMAQEALLKAQLERQAAEEVLQGLQRINVEHLKRAAADRTEAEETLAECRYRRTHDRDQYRPSRERWVAIRFDSEKNQWAAHHDEVIAYGDTPEIACDNFDHLRVFGDKE